MIEIKRVYDPVDKEDGRRFLVDRVWPRGVKKESLHLEAWLKDVAPSTELRKWFGHDPSKWNEFQHRYLAELKSNPDSVKPLIEASKLGKMTLLYSAHDTEHNNAVVLRNYLVEVK